MLAAVFGTLRFFILQSLMHPIEIFHGMDFILTQKHIEEAKETNREIRIAESLIKENEQEQVSVVTRLRSSMEWISYLLKNIYCL